ncbi:hypothetical protein D3C77_596550 [compost metagenome]
MPPMPNPVRPRSSASCTGVWLNAESNMPIPDSARQKRINGRRPQRSAQGAINSDPAAIPNKPALSNRPICAPPSPHSAETEAAVNAITSTSKPSIMFSTMQMPMARHWNLPIGSLSTRCLRSILMGSPASRRRPEAREYRSTRARKEGGGNPGSSAPLISHS